MDEHRSGPTGEIIDSPRHRALGAASRVEIMRLVRAAGGGLTAGEVAGRTGQHLSTTRAHLERLTAAGLLIKARASGGEPGRPAWRYRPTATDDTPAPAPYRALAMALLDHLAGERGDVRAAAAEIGRGWGRSLVASVEPTERPVDRLLAVLTALGFDPTVPASQPAEIHLRTCPFLELVGRNPDAMCGLHLGVIRGVLEVSGGSPRDVTLEPFGAPTACVVRLRQPR